jgi:hypothetical protein
MTMAQRMDLLFFHPMAVLHPPPILVHLNTGAVTDDAF